MTRRIFFEPSGYIDQSQREMFADPPDGYEFVLPSTTMSDRVVTSDLFLQRVYSPLRSKLPFRLLPLHLLKAYFDSRTRKPPPDTDLTYAYNHIVFRDEPWICVVEHPTMLVATDSRVLRRWRGFIARQLASPQCRKIICWSEAGRRALLANIDCSRFEDKIEVIPLAVRPRDFVKQQRTDGRVKLLFVGSGNALGGFHLKGGKEAIEAFRRLAEEYDNLEFTVRSDMPQEWKQRCQGIPRLRLIDRWVEWADLEREYQTADIFVHTAVYPGHHVAVLDAMSYELAVIATDYGDVCERIEEGVTGMLVPPSPRLPAYGENLLAIRQTPARAAFDRANRVVDETIVAGVVERARRLIEDVELRHAMGQAGRQVVDHGGLSVAARNHALKRIFDEALPEQPLTIEAGAPA